MFKAISREEMEKKIASGEAKRIHLYSVQNVLRPRGGVLEKESLSLRIFEQLQSVYESWTDPEYGDSLSKAELVELLEKNLNEEVKMAWELFKEEVVK